MESIIVEKEEKINNGWRFSIVVGGANNSREYAVVVDESYWRTLADGAITPAELVKRSFQFLLAREPKESILSSFNLKQIQGYFPEYEEEVKKLL